MTDKMIAQVKADAQAALEANNATITSIINKMEEASKGVTDMVDDFNKNLNATYKKSKTILDNRAKEYRSSVAKLFVLDGWRQLFFLVGDVWQYYHAYFVDCFTGFELAIGQYMKSRCYSLHVSICFLLLLQSTN